MYADELLFFGRQHKKRADDFFVVGFRRTHLIWMPPNISVVFSHPLSLHSVTTFFSFGILLSYHRVSRELCDQFGDSILWRAFWVPSVTRSLSSFVWHWILWIAASVHFYFGESKNGAKCICGHFSEHKWKMQYFWPGQRAERDILCHG